MGSNRKNINLATFKKVEDFLKKQKNPIFKASIVRVIGVDYNSLNLILSILIVKKDEKGRVYLC